MHGGTLREDAAERAAEPLPRPACMDTPQRPVDDDAPALLEIHATTTDPEERAHAALYLGILLALRGPTSGGLGFLREAYEHFAGSGRRVEVVACNNLALGLREARQCVETLAVSRHAARLAEERGDGLRTAIAQSHVVNAFIALEDAPRARRELDVLRTAVHVLDGDVRHEGEKVLIGLRFELASLANDVAGMRKARDAAAELGVLAPVSASAYGAAIAHREERYADVLKHACDYPEDNWYADRVYLAQLEARTRLGDAATARIAAREALSRAHAESGTPRSPAWRLQIAHAVHGVAERIGDRELRRESLEVAAAASLARVRELREFATRYPTFVTHSPDDQQALDEYRQRVRARYQDVLCAASRLIAAESTLPAPTFGPVDACALAICAWCGRLAGPDGVWLDLGDAPMPADAQRVTHGICENCHAAELSRMAPVPGH